MSFEAVNMITDAEALAKKKIADAETAAKQLIAKAEENGKAAVKAALEKAADEAAEKFGFSRPTAYRALANLAAKNPLISRNGLGIFVNAPGKTSCQLRIWCFIIRKCHLE